MEQNQQYLNGTTPYRDSGHDPDDQYNTSIQYQTSLIVNEDDQEEGVPSNPPGSDPGNEYENGTMLMIPDDDMNTMLMTPDGDDGNDGNEDDEYDPYADGTMLINDNEGDTTPRGGYGDDQKDESDVQFADSTMLINHEITNPPVKRQREIKRIQSVFAKIDLDELLPIPLDVSKDELFAIFKRLKAVTISDTEKMESWYREHIHDLDQRIRTMD